MLPAPPEKYFMTVGSGEGITQLNAFDSALVHAGIGHYNLIKVTSICPPSAVRTLTIDAKPGVIVPTAFASIQSVTPDEIIAAAVAVAVPANPQLPGLIMEYSAHGHKSESEDIVRSMAAQGMEMRGYEIASLESLAIEHRVLRKGCVIAAVLLW